MRYFCVLIFYYILAEMIGMPLALTQQICAAKGQAFSFTEHFRKKAFCTAASLLICFFISATN